MMLRSCGAHLRDSKLSAHTVCLFILWIIIAVNVYILYTIEPLNYLFSPHVVVRSSSVDDGIITALSAGRLGNNMFEYAALYALSHTTKCLAIMAPPMSTLLRPCFLVTMSTNWSMDRYAEWRVEPLAHLQTDNARNISCNGEYVRLTGYPSDWRYFSQDEQAIRREFTFSTSIADEADAFLAKARRQKVNNDANVPVTFVGVHVRRTDYSAYLERQDCVSADRKYLVAAMDRFVAKYKNVLFVVASDDPDEASTMLADVDFPKVLVDGTFSSCTSLAILSRCNHSVITQGTFGFWAAYLAGGETVYFTNYCHDKTDLLPKFQGLHLDNWIGISASTLES